MTLNGIPRLNINKSYKGYVIGFIVLMFLISFLFIGFKYGTYHPDPNSEIVQTLLNDLLIKEKEHYEQIIKEKDQQIKIIQDQLKESDILIEKYKDELKKIDDLVTNIQLPNSVEEIRERLKVLGYETY